LHAYSNSAIEDAVTKRLQSQFAHWRSVARLPDESLAEQIRSDAIDILVDLSGHTAKNRLMTFARKPAPIQASWLGYPGTTGLTAIDYYISDGRILPPGKFDNQFTEKIVRLPACAPFSPYHRSPPLNGLPALVDGVTTFGSFNRLNKLSPEVISLWAGLLRVVPKSRMLIGAMNEGGGQEFLVNWFAREGVESDRLCFHKRCSIYDYLLLHHQVDICLDTFPYTGGTTTSHALWMGVPTLTLAGDTVAGRSSAAILSQAGLQDFIANDPVEFVHKGVFWSENLPELAGIRAELRQRVSASAMGQAGVVADSLARALRIMWERYCAGMPAESFEIDWQRSVGPRLEANQ
jgi:predicted O-linked N-acetylglucosamine transferase (SPINDLY family)